MLEYILICIIVIGLIYETICFLVLRLEIKKYSKKKIKHKFFPKVTILKPVKGIDDNFENNIRSYLELDYPNFDVIFGLHSVNDPAYSIINKLVNEYPNVTTKIVVIEKDIGLNPKVNNLSNMYPHATGEIIFISDSNTCVEKDFLTKIVQEFTDEKLGLVTATIRGERSRKLTALMENIHLNTFVASIVHAASYVANVQIVIGKSILIRKEVLDKIGGLFAFRNYLAEDHIMGLKVKEISYKVKIVPLIIKNVNENWTLQNFLNRQKRWAIIRYKIEPLFYLLEIFTNVSFFSLLLLIEKFDLWYISIIAISIKMILDVLIAKTIKFNIKLAEAFIIPIKDILIALVWFIPLFHNRINWRNTKLKVNKLTYLSPVN